MDKFLEDRKFKEEDKIRCLRWCDRHCCLCKKNCGLHIEIAHIDRKLETGLNDIDNAIPLCYECHAIVGHYNNEEPRGNKYKTQELKKRREEVYEQFTRHLVPLIDCQISQLTFFETLRIFPDVGFTLKHNERGLPVNVSVKIKLSNDSLSENLAGHYGGEKLWKLNPALVAHGHFEIPSKFLLAGVNSISATVDLSIIDESGRRHDLLPMQWVYEINKPEQGWWYNP